jgi:hypothetical protein
MKKIINLATLELVINNNYDIYKQQTEKISIVTILNTPLIQIMAMINNKELYYNPEY